ncbi:MAG: glucose-1-phosphate adenylyltransferase, partial [Pseudomonadota bacterium]|nr:glucose-1-phosphate adenylyltransferase [Pseudomonadota bacterium]
GKNIIPRAVKNHKTFAYSSVDPRTGKRNYWRDVGAIDSFWKANLELIGVNPELNLYDKEWPIWTYQTQAPPAKFVLDEDGRRGQAIDSMVSGGCIISGALVRHSLLFSNVRVEERSVVENSVILPGVVIEENCEVRNAVIDRGTVIPADTKIGVDPKEDRQRFRVTGNGVVLVTGEMLGQELHRVL